MPNRDATIAFRATCLRSTEKALLIRIPGARVTDDRELWVPKSVIDTASDVKAPGHTGAIIVAEWWYDKNVA